MSLRPPIKSSGSAAEGEVDEAAKLQVIRPISTGSSRALPIDEAVAKISATANFGNWPNTNMKCNCRALRKFRPEGRSPKRFARQRVAVGAINAPVRTRLAQTFHTANDGKARGDVLKLRWAVRWAIGAR